MKSSVLSACFILLYLTTSAQETHASYVFLGFSSDLKYVAMETYAEGGTEFEPPWTKFILVEVDKNSYATNTINFKGKPENAIENVRKQGKKLADPKLASFNIKGNNPGTKIPLNIEENGDTDVLSFIFNGIQYEVILKSVETGAILLGMYDQKKMDLSIRYKGKTQILQRDKNVPASRGFVVDYKIKDAYITDGRLAIIVEYSVGPGFEGVMDTYQMLVTGRLN